MKLNIRRKLLILTGALSAALIFAAVFTSYLTFSSMSKNDMFKLCETTADETAAFLKEKYSGFFEKYASKIMEIYRSNVSELESVENPYESFKSYEERRAYYEQLTQDIFPATSGFGMSYESLELRNNYISVVQHLDLIRTAEQMDDAFIFLYDRERGNIVYLIDSTSDNSLTYHFPCSIEKPEESYRSHLGLPEKGKPETFFENDGCSSVDVLLDAEGTGTVYVSFGQVDERLRSNRKWFALSTLFIIFGATVVLAFFYLLFADRLIVRNVKKLTRATESFTSGLNSEEGPRLCSAGVDSKDELGELSRTVDLMQTSILGYVDTLACKTAEEEKMKAELDIAARIQREALPSGDFETDRLKLSSFLRPAKEVGGDFYDYFLLPDGRLFFYIADVSGKGVPAALFMMRSKELIKSLAASGKDLKTLAYEVNNALCEGNAEGLFLTAFFGIADMENGRLEYLRAGHEQPFLKRGNAVTRFSEEANFIIGAFDETTYESESESLAEGDQLLFFTDGLNEGIDKNEEAFGYDRIRAVMEGPSDRLPEKLYAALEAFTDGEDQFDDVTMLCLTVKRELHFTFNRQSYDDIPPVLDKVTEVLSDRDEDCVRRLGVILDELLNNCISYAFDGNPDPHAELIVRADEETAFIRLTDNGIPFNPLEYENDPPAEVGGAGIGIVRTLAEKTDYRRKNNENVLEIRASLNGSGPEAALV